MASDPSAKDALATAKRLIADGDFEAAETALQRLENHPELGTLGPETALGLPRRLHAARLRLAKRRGDLRAKTALQYHLVPPVEVLAPLFAPEPALRQAMVAASAEPVPQVLHQIWLGGPPPETIEVWRGEAARRGWSYKLWDEAALAALGVDRHPVFQDMAARSEWPGAVDVARYAMLHAEGGLYLDCDWMPAGPSFAEAIPPRGLSAIAEATPRKTGVGSPFLNNSVIAAPPRHPVFERLLARLPEVAARLPGGPAWWNTGPLVFTLAARAGPVTLLDAGFETGPVEGDRTALDRAVSNLRAPGDPAVLIGWKPWA